MDSNDDEVQKRQMRVRAAYANGFKEYSTSVESTGVVSQQLRYRHLAFGTENNIAEQFLVNTRLQRSDSSGPLSIAQYFDSVGSTLLGLQHEPQGRDESHIDLPSNPPMEMSLISALEARRSVREYTGDSISFNSLAGLIRCAGGITAQAHFNDSAGIAQQFSVRTVPSGGGLYPIDLYVLPRRVKSLQSAIYRYMPVTDNLALELPTPREEVLRAAFNFPDEFISFTRCCAIVFFVATPWKSMRKYGSRGMRYVLHESGSMAMALHLGATALGVSTVDCASYFDNEMNTIFGLDGVSSAVIHCVFVGIGGA